MDHAGKRKGEAISMNSHEKHCFVAIATGRTDSEIIEFAGWRDEVIVPAVKDAGYEPIISTASVAPTHITEEILGHLAFDPMVVADIGGVTSADDPNPKVMYELGIRHAFKLPHVILAWKDQRLPFDIGGQRAIMADRRALYFKENRLKLRAFIKAAEDGLYYKPLESVALAAELKIAAEDSRDPVLANMARELAEIKQIVLRVASEESRPRPRVVLTPRESEIIACVAQGYRNREIAEKFGLSEDTVKSHLTNMFKKIRVSDRLELALYAIHHQLIDTDND
jgi:DNA-binding CsgD family transcriptional regulator